MQGLNRALLTAILLIAIIPHVYANTNPYPETFTDDEWQMAQALPAISAEEQIMIYGKNLFRFSGGNIEINENGYIITNSTISINSLHMGLRRWAAMTSTQSPPLTINPSSVLYTSEPVYDNGKIVIHAGWRHERPEPDEDDPYEPYEPEEQGRPNGANPETLLALGVMSGILAVMVFSGGMRNAT